MTKAFKHIHVYSHACTVVLINVSNVCCLQDVGAPITPREEVTIALYDVARPENMSPAFINTDDAPPPGYDVVCKEHMQSSPEYETVPLALASKPTLTSENPPPLPPPMIRGDSEAPDLPPPYNPAVDNESVNLTVESSISQSVENRSVDIDGEVDESVKRDQSVRDESLNNGETLTEEVTGSTEAQPNEREVSRSVPESEVVEAKDATQGSEVVPIQEVGGREERIAAQVRSTEVYRHSRCCL